MNKLLFLVGMSGSGKSYLRQKVSNRFGPKMNTISPDDLRKKILGDIDNQDENNRIFQIAYSQTLKSLQDYEITYFDATGLNWSRNKKQIESYVNELDIKVYIIFMMDSEDLELCKERVMGDILIGKDRSNVPEEVLETQHQKFNQCLKNALNDKTLPDNWNIILYDGNFESLIGELKNG